ncbi:MAG: hydantoinase/oxoprolinase family protein [Clostridiales bacterium]|nr:hydantoinase/oxoprolinase family protein [Clostridiales bacterium]
MYKLGIDVGGTNTDAVLIDQTGRVYAEVKYPTSKDVYSGIMGAVQILLDRSGVDPALISRAMLGTTQCTNAIVERRGLAPVGVLRLGSPATLGIQPMTDWAEDLKATCADWAVIGGGYEYDGREIAPLDEKAAADFFRSLRGRVKAVAITGVFSNIRSDQELHAAEICREILGDSIHISLSHQIGSMGLIERENATILNAALFEVSHRFTEGFARSLADEGITNARIYLSQNDGTLMTMEQARRHPILTIACGPTNSIRGACCLSGQTDAIVMDVGGTTTDLGVVRAGFPRESSAAAVIGGVRTNFRMPDVLSIGLGGGSIVRKKADGAVTVGPDSVGYAITEEALVFGGHTITATDIAVRLGMAEVGNPALVSGLEESFARQAMAVITAMAEESLDAMKLSGSDVRVVLVGGGSIILPPVLAGASEVIKPTHFGVANAIGSAISKISGTSDSLADYQQIPREEAMAQAREKAIRLAVQAGAIPSTVEIVESEDIPLAYHPGNTCRIKVKAAGDLDESDSLPIHP